MDAADYTQIKVTHSLCEPILVTGAPRSGTTMTAGILRRCGAWVGHVDATYENIDVRDRVMIPYFKFIGADPRGQNPLPNVDNLKPLAGLARRVETFVKFQGYRYGQWMVKSNRIILTWPLWRETFSGAKWVIVRRKPVDVVNSCMKTCYMDGHKDEPGWASWLNQYQKRFNALHASGANVREIWPCRFIAGDYSEVEDVVQWLGLQWNEAKIRDYVNPELWRDYDGKSNNG